MSKIVLRKKIIAAMKKQKISVPAMSRAIGCNQQTLYNYFAGQTQIGSDKLEAIVNELGATLKF